MHIIAVGLRYRVVTVDVKGLACLSLGLSTSASAQLGLGDFGSAEAWDLKVPSWFDEPGATFSKLPKFFLKIFLRFS